MPQRSPQRVLDAALVVAVVVAIFGVVKVTALAPSPPATTDVQGTMSARSAEASTPSPATSGPGAVGSTTASAPPAVGPTPGTKVTTGPGLTEPGIHVLAEPDARGAVEVVERVRLATSVTRIQVAPPDVTGAKGFEGVQPVLRGLQMTADGIPVALSATASSGGLVDLPRRSDAIALRYSLDGATTRTEPSPIGRVLIAVSPVTAKGFGDLPVVVEVVGSGVRNLVCPQLSDKAQLCGRNIGATWVTSKIPADRSSVVAQFDLREPGST